ncbi:pentapeptide repeat-containing protein [Glycomyces buryatensis]|uniref:Pentapeptide repeat-containing protein n=1 Tax=Glycomyces buryatensis TaxID=2570927 RepID=A0A4S8QKD1_9ACTN|nr:pentapeptide repeat-containing protein [Glycomyces buryatensis]THV41204.1 pentapeptide repeat-containing protein [Glycomyces buryatensis]
MRDDPPRGPRPISGWALPLVLVSIVLGGWWFYDLQAAQVDAVNADNSIETELELTRLRVESLRNMLAVGAGVGGLAALVLGFRRQQHNEYDATQQRITELRIKAVEQLGSDKPTVRIGGLHNLERLGEQHEELRQIVLDEICAYLRLPYAPPKRDKGNGRESRGFEPVGPPPAEDRAAEMEGTVRMLAQEILQRHLNPKFGKGQYWKHRRIHLSGAYLDRINFSNCRLERALFAGATFAGKTRFVQTTFTRSPSFNGATFEGEAWFNSAIFNERAYFADTTFLKQVRFGAAMFIDYAEFTGTRFCGFTSFDWAQFERVADFKASFLSGASAHRMSVRLLRYWTPDHPPSGKPPTDIMDAFEAGGVSIGLEPLLEDDVFLLETDVGEGWKVEPLPEDPDWGRLVRTDAQPED